METKKYDEMTKNELVKTCLVKDEMIDKCIISLKSSEKRLLNKEDIMAKYKCENDKALKILKLMCQTGFGIKIGKEYYVSEKAHDDFLNLYAGKNVAI